METKFHQLTHISRNPSFPLIRMGKTSLGLQNLVR